jgi:hypothetical protein
MSLCLFFQFLRIKLSNPDPEVIKLIAFELAGEDREQRGTPVLSRLKIAFYALHTRGWTGFPHHLEHFALGFHWLRFMRVYVCMYVCMQ